MNLKATQSNYGFLIEITMKKIKHTFQRLLSESGYDITVDQWVIIDQLIVKKELSQNELCSLTHKDPPTITRIIDLLVKKDIVKRAQHAGDRRKFSITLTEKGLQIHTAILPGVVNLRNAGWEHLSAQDLDDLFRILRQVYQNMDGLGKQ